MKKCSAVVLGLACLFNCGTQSYSAELNDYSVFTETSAQEEKGRTYTLEELCYFALERNPRLQAKEFNISADEARVKLRKMEMLPNLNLNTNYTQSDETDLLRMGARVSWDIDYSKLLMRDIKLARMGLLTAKENLERERVWVLNDIADRYRHIVAQEFRAKTYTEVIAVLEGLSTSDIQFMKERDLKLIEYEAKLTALRNNIVDTVSDISGLSFGDPYTGDLTIDMSLLQYRELPLEKKDVLRRAVHERMEPDVYRLRQQELLVKMSTRRFQPSIYAGIEQWRVQGIAGQGYDDSDMSWNGGANLRVNPIASKAQKAEARAELNFARADVNNALINLINNAKRAYDRYKLAEENLLHYDMVSVDFVFEMASVPVDRQYFNTLDLFLQKDLTRIQYFSDYFASLYDLNRYVMLTPLSMDEYHSLGFDNSMPDIFSYLELPSSVYERHRSELLFE